MIYVWQRCVTFSLVGVLCLLLAVGYFNPQAAAQSLSESIFAYNTFSGATTSNWKYIQSVGSDPPCLTAAPLGSLVTGSIPGCPTNTTNAAFLPEAAGSGALRLTSSKNNQSGFVYWDQPLPTNKGLQFMFDVYAYNGSSTGADGFSFILFDGSQELTRTGGYGGSLGYAQHGNIHGFPGGYLGIGFDEYGNFANDSESRGRNCINRSPNRSNTRVPHSITMRGSGNGLNGYCYLTGTKNFKTTENISFDFPNIQFRQPSQKRRFLVSLSDTNVITVSVDFGNGMRTVINEYNLESSSDQAPLPETLKFGFAASTGGLRNIHEVDSIKATINTPDLFVTQTLSQPVVPGGSSTYSISVQNSQSAEDTSSPTNVDVVFPKEVTITEVNGENWESSHTKQTVSASYSEPIMNGESAEPLNIEVQFDETATPSIASVARVSNSEELNDSYTDNYTFFSESDGNIQTNTETFQSFYSLSDAVNQTVSNCDFSVDEVHSASEDKANTLLLGCVNSGTLSLYAPDAIDNNDICSDADIEQLKTVETHKTGAPYNAINCTIDENTIYLGGLTTDNVRQYPTTNLEDLIFEDLRGQEQATYTITASIESLKDNNSNNAFELGTNPDQVSSDSHIDAPTGNNIGKLFSVMDCSMGEIDVLRDSLAIDQGDLFYQIGPKETVVSKDTQITILSTLDSVRPARVDLDGCWLTYSVPAYPTPGFYKGLVIFTIV